MYLKSLEIQGFKSFPDKISLTFDKGLTAVVGPNGSGKSNIGDSVRWVLGEQSTKTLRGNKMEDIIFSGTVTRKQMGFAAVTLTIDNSDKKLPECDDEVAVTRKLYRSGESEYMINGRQVRLKDIYELFMDTGLGRDGYSIIGQGRIAEIVSAKSSERRVIFEEAAGISKFRYKKLEAERKLAAAQENLLRLTDIMSELESRVEPLKIQSQKAEKFIELSEKRKKTEISVWVYRLDELKSKLDELDDKILVSRSEYENAENDIRNQEEKIRVGYRTMQEYTVKSDELRRKMLEEEQSSSSLKSDIAVFENDIRYCETASATARKSLEECSASKLELEEKLIKAETELERISSERNILENKIAELTENFRKAERESTEYDSSFDRTGSEINALYIKQSELRFSLETARNNAVEEKKRLAELDDSGKSYDKTLSSYNERISDSKKKETECIEKSTGLKNKLSGLEQLFKSRRENYDKAKSDFEQIFYDMKGKQQRRKILSDLENNMDGFAGSVKLVLKAAKQGRLSGIFGTVAQNINVEPQYAVAIETALGGAMQNIIVENEDSAKRCIRYLKEQRGGRATFLPVTSVRGYEFRERGVEECEGFIACADRIVRTDSKFSGIISSLLGRIVIAEDIDTATVIAKNYGYRFRIVTLDGQVINAGGSFTGGSAQKSGGMITRKNEIETLDSEIEELSANRENLRVRVERLRAESEKLRLDIEGVKEEITSNENETVRIRAELYSLESMSEQLRSQSADSEKLTAESVRRLQSAEENAVQTERELAELDEKIRTAETELQQGQNTRENLKRKREELSGQLSDMKIRNMELAKDYQAAEREIDDINQRIADNSDKIKMYEAEIARQSEIVVQKRQEIEKTKQKLESFHSNTGIYNEKITEFRKLHDEQNRVVREMQQGLRELNTAKEKLSANVTRLEERRDMTQRDCDNIIKQMLEVYEMTRSEAVQLADKIEDITEAQRQLADLKNKIRALGNVSVESIEEYREVSERYVFMSGQIDDIKKSKAELEKIITDLTEEMCRIFSESFAIINSNFKSIFVELFGGGKAELILTEPDNVLESGIEISVAPPGKVIKNLISLSGGEQSFVAIAIYFAILKLRPAPFCILDEIDAALDEVNVRKYAQYLKKFTDTTQFVLVTHRRSAMEEANVLYGVTMQEDGISKLLKMEQVDFQGDDDNKEMN
jgi:chromosome segregation protein